MNTLVSANKKSTSSTSSRQHTNNIITSPLQRKTNGNDTDALSKIISNNSSSNSYNYSPNTNINSRSNCLNSIIQNSFVQRKLTIGKKSDRFEQEADQTSEKVVSSPSPFVQPVLQRQEEEEPQAKPMVQLQAEEEEPQAKPMVQRQAEEEEPVQTKGGTGGQVSAGFKSQLKSTRGSGEPIPDTTKSSMESSFGHDFSNVRVHTGGNAVQMSKEVGAQAFTQGNDIYFNEGKFDTGSTQGKRLLAHELTHTIQQGASLKLQRFNSPQHTIQRQEEPTTEEIDVEAELAASEEEAVAAVDPVPAEESKKEAQEELPEEEEPKEEPIEKEGEKKEKPAAEVPKKGKKAAIALPGKGEKEEAPKGEVGQFLEEESAGVCGQAAGKAQVLADNEQTHDDAEKKLSQTEDSVVPPAKEGQSQSNAGQVDKLDESPAPEPSEEAARNTLNNAVDQSVPKKIKDLNEFKSKGKAKVVGNKVMGNVNKETDAVLTTYNEIEKAPPAKPPEKKPVELPGEEITPETPELNLGKNAVPQLKDEHTDFNKFDQQSDGLLEKEGIKEENLNMVDEGELFEAKKERKGLKQKVTEQPAQLQKFAQNEVQKVDKDMQQEEKKSRADMRNKRQQGLTKTKDKQKKTKSALELKREAVTKEINGIYEKAKSSVTTKLNNLEKQSLKAFDRGQEKASREFEYEVNRDVNRWKRKRYSGFWGPAKWLKDKLVGIDDFPEVKQIFERAKADYIVKIDQLILNITKDNNKVIKECKEELANARKEIKKFVDTLGPELKATGQQAMAEMKSKLDEMDKFIDKKKDELAKKLCNKKEEAIKKIDEKIEKMKEEMSGALSKLGNLLLNALLKFFKWALKKAGYDEKQLMSIINKGKAVIKKIVGDPIGFIMNIVNAVKLGINNFKNNIKKHLVGGLITWLTGAMGNIGIQLPAKFDMKGILSIVLQILGLTWDNIRQKLVKRLGEKVVGAVEKGVDIVKQIITKGPIALWDIIKAKAAEIKSRVMEGIRNWAIVELVKKGIIQLISFLNPAGAIVQAILAIYNTIMFFVENWDRVVQFVKTVFNSIADMAMGKISAAAAAVEKSLAMTIPIILNFLARLLRLSGIGKAIKKIIMKIREPIDKILNKAIDFIVKKAKALFKKGKAAAEKGIEKGKEAGKWVIKKVLGWWTLKTKLKAADGKSHKIYFKGKGKKAPLVVASAEEEIKKYLESKRKDHAGNAEMGRYVNLGLENLGNVFSARDALDALATEREMLPKPGEKGISDKVKESRKRDIEAKDRVIANKFRDMEGYSKELGQAIIKLGFEDTPLNKESVPSLVTPRSHGHVLALPLSFMAGNTSGKPTTGKENVPGFKLLARMYKSAPSKLTDWRRMHLVADRFHGPIENWNLVPGPSTANNRMASQAETPLWSYIKTPGNILRYEVKTRFRPESEIEGKAKKVIPQNELKNYDDEFDKFPSFITINFHALKQTQPNKFEKSNEETKKLTAGSPANIEVLPPEPTTGTLTVVIKDTQWENLREYSKNAFSQSLAKRINRASSQYGSLTLKEGLLEASKEGYRSKKLSRLKREADEAKSRAKANPDSVQLAEEAQSKLVVLNQEAQKQADIDWQSIKNFVKNPPSDYNWVIER